VPARFPAGQHVMARADEQHAPPRWPVSGLAHRPVWPSQRRLTRLQWPVTRAGASKDKLRALTVAGAARVGVAAWRRRFPIPVYPAPCMKQGAGTNDADDNAAHHFSLPRMATLHDLAMRIDRLLLRHEELARTNKLLLEQVASLSSERDSLKSRLSAARTRIDTLLERLPSGGESDKDSR
jgi:cell division protein ZapB